MFQARSCDELPWITPHLERRMHARNILKLKAFLSKNAYDWLKFTK